MATQKPVFRITTYQFKPGDFTGTTFDLSLQHTLSENYFVMIESSAEESGAEFARVICARVSADPYGTGDLAVINGNKLTLTRFASDTNWVGTVTVVECLGDHDTNGFRLRSVVESTFIDNSLTNAIESTSDTSDTDWSDINQVVLFGGPHGGGASVDSATAVYATFMSVGLRIYPSGSNTLNYERYATSTASSLEAATAVTYVVEWGSAWNVQRSNITGSSGGSLGSTGSYDSATISSVVRENTWVWGCGYTQDDNTDNAWFGLVLTLGDGVNQNASETSISVGQLSGITKSYESYALTHSSMFAHSQFQITVAGGENERDWTVPSSLSEEQFGTDSDGVDYTVSDRFGRQYSCVNTASQGYMHAAGWAVRYDSDTNLYGYRGQSSTQWSAWIHSFDMGSVTHTDGLPETEGTCGPDQFVIIQDPNFLGSESAASYGIANGASIGSLLSLSTNQGSMIGFQEGIPTSFDTLTYHITRSGRTDESTGLIWKKSTDLDLYYRGLNHPLHLHRAEAFTPTAKVLYPAVAYSKELDLVMVVQNDGDADFDTYRRSADTNTWTSGAISFGSYPETLNTTIEGGVALISKPGGGFVLFTRTVDPFSVGWHDISSYTSDDGVTWSRMTDKIFSSIGRTNDTFRQIQAARSGSWVRILGVQDATPAINKIINTLISADGGVSWVYDSTSHTSFSDAGIEQATAAFSIVGIDDASGTFLFASVQTGGSTVTIKAASRDEDWVTYPDLEIDTTGGGITSADIAGMTFVKSHSRIFLYVWREGSDAQDIRVWSCDIASPLQASSWVLNGSVDDVQGARDYMPFMPTACWAGNQKVFVYSLFDPDVVADDPVIAEGRACVAVAGGWSQFPANVTTNGQNAEYMIRHPKMSDVMWYSAMGTPDSDTLSGWSISTAGASPTVAWTPNEVTITCNATDEQYYYRYDYSETTVAWAVSMSCDGTRDDIETSGDTGMRFITGTTTAYRNYCDLRVADDKIVVYDILGATAKAVIAGDFTVRTDFRIHITATSTVSEVMIMFRAHSADVDTAWNIYGPYTLSQSTTSTARMVMGATNTGTTTGPSIIKIYEACLLSRNLPFDHYYLDQTSEIFPNDYAGHYISKYPFLVKGGVYTKFGGSGAIVDDEYTSSFNYTYGVDNLNIDSPRFYWEHESTAEAGISFDAVQRDEAFYSGRRFSIDAVALIGTVDSTAKIQFNQTETWTAPAEEYDMSAVVFEDIYVAEVSGTSVRVEAHFGAWLPDAGESTDMYIRVVSGTQRGKTYKIIADSSGDGWLQLDTDHTLGVSLMANQEVVIFSDRMVYRGAAVSRYRYMRVVFPDTGSDGLNHRLGAIVPGTRLSVDVPMDWTFRDNSQPNVVESRTRGGATWVLSEGPPQRTIEGRIVGDVNRWREKAKNMLGKLHGYNEKPTALVLDSLIPHGSMVYGRWQSGGQLDNAVWYQDDNGVWRTGGDMALVFVEES